ncbi:M4 family metallopeptidase [Mycolicibacterium sp. OfavD-34-C]|uniref:M4 family metallopeptidase n=1 Tax=Mycolicibacterium sp. OfavD-34-C TaxID=2917746 RepID=UPI001EF7021F|nr:M4 family metallopeptidase [Mycolicibacterium sp. OfavD-34-C]MCG7579556.1 M4 family metallopeptidase [Mycolicibacterium sp. OfavD-34-C]
MSAAVLLTFLGVGPVVAEGVAAASPSDTAAQSGDTPSAPSSEGNSAPDGAAAEEVAADDDDADGAAPEDDAADDDVDYDAAEEAAADDDAAVDDDADGAPGDGSGEESGRLDEAPVISDTEEVEDAVDVGDDAAATPDQLEQHPDGTTERAADSAIAAPAADDAAAQSPGGASGLEPRSVVGAPAEPEHSAELTTANAERVGLPEATEQPAVMADKPAVAPESTTLAASRSVRRIVAARPVTVDSIVTDLLTWVGLGPAAHGLPIPATPVSALMESLWLAVRQAQYVLNNQRPTADVTVSGPGPDRVVTGALNAVDYDDLSLTYTVTAAPTNGRVVLDASGGFTYTPEVPGRADQFTVTVDDTVGNPAHIHGLLGLLGITGPTQVVVRIGGAAAANPVQLAELRTRDGVSVGVTEGGAVRVIEGRFTDQVVTGAADAAAVLNALAPLLGAAPGFADAADIDTDRAGVGPGVENFYHYTENLGDVTVLGSDIILVTDADGLVTSLFNNYVGLGAAFDITPDEGVDEHDEVSLLAGAAYLGADADGEVLQTFLAQTDVTTALVVYALDQQADPELAWQVVLRFPDTGDLSPSAVTYVVDADGRDAGSIIVTVTSGQGASVDSVATDWLGESRNITVDRGGWLFPSYTMVDDTRNITTYTTSYVFFVGGPVLPGRVVKRGWLGWNRGAVSAHANTAVVYDYYEDVLGRTSFDGDGALVEVSIRYNPINIYRASGYANAFWDPTRQQFAFGDGGYLQASLDVVAHEFTHAVVSYVVGAGGSVLDYGESGALNEAYADILGLLVEGKSGADRWLIAEDSDYGIIRNLADPTSVRTGLGPYRDHYDTRYTGTGDDGGEHVNSTIFGHAAYLMMTDAATASVSDEAWARVFYHSLFRLGRSAVFADGRAAVLSAAAAQGFSADQLDAIRSAFDDVGIAGPAESALLVA